MTRSDSRWTISNIGTVALLAAANHTLWELGLPTLPFSCSRRIQMLIAGRSDAIAHLRGT
jgi:hypothetical protein